jgi:CRP-like cAMP-binding protein
MTSLDTLLAIQSPSARSSLEIPNAQPRRVSRSHTPSSTSRRSLSPLSQHSPQPHSPSSRSKSRLSPLNRSPRHSDSQRKFFARNSNVPTSPEKKQSSATTTTTTTNAVFFEKVSDRSQRHLTSAHTKRRITKSPPRPSRTPVSTLPFISDEHSVLESAPFVSHLTLDELKELHSLCKVEHFQADECIVSEGTLLEDIFVIVKGTVQLLMENNIQICVRKDGDYFGVSNWRKAKQSVLSAIAITETKLLRISSTSLRQFITKQSEALMLPFEKPIEDQLIEIPFLSELSEKRLAQLSSLFLWKRFSAGDWIFRQGDMADGFYIIVSGRIQVSAIGPGGHSVQLNTISNGDWFGEIALIQQTTRTATTICDTNCLVLFLPSDDFQSFLTFSPELASSPSFSSTIVRRTANSLKTIPLFSFLQRKTSHRTSRINATFVSPPPASSSDTFDESKLALLGELFQFQLFEKNAVVFREGDEADAFYIIHRGSVAVIGRSDGSDLIEKEGLDPAILEILGDPPNSNYVLLTELTKNDWFGEIALVSHTRRTATIITKTPCVLLKLLSRNFNSFLEIVPEVRNTFNRVMSVRITQTLATIPFFREIKENRPWSKLNILGSMFDFEFLPTGAVVIREGEVGDKFYVIVDGSVEISKAITGPQGTKVIRLEVLQKNAWFGEIALLRECKRLATITCLEDCLFLTVTKEKFNRFMEVAPDIVDHFSALVTYHTVNFLKHIPLFTKNLHENKPWSKLELLCSMFTYEYVAESAYVMRQGEASSQSNKFYVISKGTVVCRDETTNTERILSKGEYFGEQSLICTAPREFTIYTREACVFLTLTRQKFHQFLKVAPELRAGLIAMNPHLVPESPVNEPPSPFRMLDEKENDKYNYNVFIHHQMEEQLESRFRPRKYENDDDHQNGTSDDNGFFNTNYETGDLPIVHVSAYSGTPSVSHSMTNSPLSRSRSLRIDTTKPTHAHSASISYPVVQPSKRLPSPLPLPSGSPSSSSISRNSEITSAVFFHDDDD